MTGDHAGFGSTAPDQTASAAGAAGAAALPVAPGQVVALYGQLIGPSSAAGAQVDSSGPSVTG
jgi:hypothetical protein